MFDGLSEKFSNVYRKLAGEKSLTEDNIKEALREVRMALLEADVNYLIVKDFMKGIREEAVGQNIVKGVQPAQQFISIVQKGLEKMMQGDTAPEGEGGDKPFEIRSGEESNILMLGLQGAGKTTFTGKLARFLEKKDIKPMLVACDIYRPAAIEQLKQVGGSLDIPVFEMGTDHHPVEIIENARAKAREQGRDCLIIDTAGRLAIDEVKMDELREIRDRVTPDYTFLVADAMTGQDAVNSAQTFHEQVGIDGVCLTKLDGDARGGAALSIKAVTGRPVVFVGIGEKVDDLERFHPERAAQRILGMGDVASLVEKAEEAMEGQDTKKMTEKLATGEFNYNDFISQMKMINRMGSIKGLLGMIPGLNSMMGALDNDQLSKEMGRVEAMISSMTNNERLKPDLVLKEKSRRWRIAKGSGHKPEQVTALVNQFEQMRGMMKTMASGSGMFGDMKAKAAASQSMPKPGDILSGQGPVPQMPANMDPSTQTIPKNMTPEMMGMTPEMPGYKKAKREIKALKKQQQSGGGGSNMTLSKKAKKKRRK